jgi:hypothetical protein
MSLPVPVTRNRLLEAPCVFIFGISPCLLFLRAGARLYGVPSGTVCLARRHEPPGYLMPGPVHAAL